MEETEEEDGDGGAVGWSVVGLCGRFEGSGLGEEEEEKEESSECQSKR